MAQAAVDVERIVDESRLGRFQLRAIALCGLISLLDGYDLQTMAFLTPTLAAEWGIVASEFRLVLSASLLGLAIGALTAGPLSDRYGRRTVLLAALLVLSGSTLACATVGDLRGLFIWRFATGLGLGASMPNIIALTAEYSPARNRALLISLMLCGLPLGGALGGQLAAELIATFGWQSVFIVGGLIPVILFAIAVPLLPESIKFLAGQGGRRERLFEILRQIQPGLALDRDASAEFGVARDIPAPIVGLFRDGRTTGTLLLWSIFFLNLFSMYFLASWLPTVLQSADWSPRQALIGTSVYHWGGLAGGLVFSHLIDRWDSFRILPPVYLATTAAIAAVGALSVSVPAASIVLALAGAGLIGAQFCLNALAAAFYPTMIRATGVGWALGIGRLGAIMSPLIAGGILGAAWPIEGFFAAAAAPLLLCAAAVMLMARTRA